MKGQNALTAISFFFLGLAAADSLSANTVTYPDYTASGEQSGGVRLTLPGTETIIVPPENVCKSPSGITITLNHYESEAIFKCGVGFTEIDPDQSGDVYLEEESDEATPLEDAVPNATLDRIDDDGIFLLTFPENRAEDYTVYYRCRSSDHGRSAHGVEVEGIRKHEQQLQSQGSSMRNVCTVKIVAKKEPLAEDPGTDKTCSKPNGLVTVILGPNETDAVFKCGDSMTTLEPTQDSYEPKVCLSQDCTKTGKLRDVIPRANWDEQNKRQHTYRLFVPTDNRTATHLWYKCKTSPGRSAGGSTGNPTNGRSNTVQQVGGACTVFIDVQTSAPRQEEEEEEVPECEAETEKKVTLLPSEPFRFQCEDKMTLQPTFSEQNQQVFDDSDGSCSKQVALTSLVDAKITEEKESPAHSQYTMELTAFPTSAKKLCLQCASSNGDPKCQTRMRIEVPASETTTTTPNTSGAGSLSGLLSSIVGLLCVGFAFSF